MRFNSPGFPRSSLLFSHQNPSNQSSDQVKKKTSFPPLGVSWMKTTRMGIRLHESTSINQQPPPAPSPAFNGCAMRKLRTLPPQLGKAQIVRLLRRSFQFDRWAPVIEVILNHWHPTLSLSPVCSSTCKKSCSHWESCCSPTTAWVWEPTSVPATFLELRLMRRIGQRTADGDGSADTSHPGKQLTVALRKAKIINIINHQ